MVRTEEGGIDVPFCWPAWRQARPAWRQARPARGPELSPRRGVVELGWTDISHLKVRRSSRVDLGGERWGTASYAKGGDQNRRYDVHWICLSISMDGGEKMAALRGWVPDFSGQQVG